MNWCASLRPKQLRRNVGKSISPDAPPEIRDMQAAAQANGFKITLLNASTLDELKTAIATLADHPSSALLVGADPFFMVRREQIVALVAQQKIPAVYPFREFADAGGLMSYGTNIANAYRQSGIYAVGFSKVPSQPIFQCSTRPVSSLWSTSRRHRLLA